MSVTENFPATLPLPLQAGYSVKVDAGILSTKMESGVTRKRRQYSVAIYTVNCTWSLTNDQFSLFDAWYEQKIDFGIKWFGMKLNIGHGVQQYECRISKPPSESVFKRGWKVRAEVELRNVTKPTYASVLSGSSA